MTEADALEGAFMAGAPSATLQGWSISLPGARLDHTYVTSSCGLKWGCWGRNSGGRGLSAGIGSSVVADCLSQPNSQAGIIYGLTGVCHQTSNRILHPAQITVAGCQGYNLSMFLYGVYGQGIWPEKSACYPPGTILAQAGGRQARQQDGNLLSSIGMYNVRVTTVRAAVIAEEVTQLAELSAMIEMALGRPLDQTTLSALLAIQTVLRQTQSALVSRLQNGELTPDQYLDQLNSTLKLAMDETRLLLGDEGFQAIFGEAGRHPAGLIQRDTFMERTITDG
jgi:hypothetical protein